MPRGLGRNAAADAARRQMMVERCVDIALPELIAETEADREVEHDVDVGPCLAARCDDGRSELHQLAGVLVDAKPDAQPLALPGAGSACRIATARSVCVALLCCSSAW
jgi:hypothetical protein